MTLLERWQACDPSALISDWADGARWFDNTAHAPSVELLEYAVLAESDGSCVILQLAILDGRLYSLALQIREKRLGTSGEPGSVGLGLIGVISNDAGGSLALFDATETPEGQDAILRAVLGSSAPHGGSLQLERVQLHGTLDDLPAISATQKLRSEQSNTSIIYRFAEPDERGSVGIILKIVRALAPGHNPDVELMSGLDQRGSRAVPHQYGSLSTQFDGEHVDLMVAQEFLDGATDAWQVMLNAVEESRDFTEGDAIRSLGAMTRSIHTDLAATFEIRDASDADRTRFRRSWASRAEKAMVAAPELEPYEQQISEIFDAAASGPWPRLQRVHGDYHLGQVLRSPGRGWYALDFEGEPLRPMAERTQVDLALRDVAGMLRSFDYVAGSATLSGASEDAMSAWAKSASEAFLDGYGELSEDEAQLLNALILDKALYEVSYEASARPTWIQIPLRGVKRLLAN